MSFMRQQKIELTETEKQELKTQAKKSIKSYERDRAKALLLSNDGMLIKDIIKIIEVHRNTIGRWLKEWKENKKVSMKNGRGAKDKLTEEMKSNLEEFMIKNPKSITKAHKMIEDKYNIDVNKVTITKHIKKTLNIKE